MDEFDNQIFLSAWVGDVPVQMNQVKAGTRLDTTSSTYNKSVGATFVSPLILVDVGYRTVTT
jgi:hypothetical protein